MWYVSTRDASQTVSFPLALINGLAPDGGLYIPKSIPEVHPTVWKNASSFSEMATEILLPWVSDHIKPDELASLLAQALNFPVSLVKVGDAWVLELFHGPTLSFKDFGARTMARFMNYFVKDDPLTILVATSGDTGSAVADGFSNLPNLRVAVLYPKEQVSPIQERQLIVRRKGVRAFAVEGTFDDCQAMVKQLLTSPSGLRLSSANSINVGRLLPQMLYYFWAFSKTPWGLADVCVPSGNLGNLTAAVLAYLSGLPVRKFIAAHNLNDGFPRFLCGGADPSDDSIQTLSNAMDVGRPSNFERLKSLLDVNELRILIQGHSCSDSRTLKSIQTIYSETGYIADPHTAVGLDAVQGSQYPVIVAATAHPAKFPGTIKQALGFSPEPVDKLTLLEEKPIRVQPLEAHHEALRSQLKYWL
ncbi:MAG: threonine synthase [Bacteroidetes bacterium]|nr:threonine synthase [Bacteroidota bacterium]